VAVHAYLYVGETIDPTNAILVTRVRPIGEPYDLDAAGVQGALVTVGREGAPAETLQMGEPGRYYNGRIQIAARTTYALRIEIPGDRVLTATTTTPIDFDLTGGPPEAPEPVRHEELQDLYPMFVNAEDPEQVFLVDVFCEEEWQDAKYIYPFGNHDEPSDFDEYGGASGEPRHIFAYFRLRNLVQEERGSRIDFYGAMMAFYGEHSVHVFSIDDNYYNYLYRDYPEENGGIVGGIGVFGSASRRAWRLDVTP
jgi:hypothetical protein